MFAGSNIHYEMADKVQAVHCGGLGAIRLMARKIGLVDAINERVTVLKRHLPYHESDHVLNLAYNILAGGLRLEDLELPRHDEAYLDGLGAQRIPDSTTAGDFTRRFTPADSLALMEAINAARQNVWRLQLTASPGNRSQRARGLGKGLAVGSEDHRVGIRAP